MEVHCFLSVVGRLIIIFRDLQRNVGRGYTLSVRHQGLVDRLKFRFSESLAHPMVDISFGLSP